MTKDGQQTPTANLTMGTYRLTNLGAATAVADAPQSAQVQNSSLTHLTSVSGVDTITANAAITPAAYVAGQKFTFVSAGANTGAVTLNVSSLGAKAVTKNGATALAAGDIPSGAVIEVSYDGTRFQLLTADVFNIIDAKGDLIAGTAADTAARLAVGTDGLVLRALASATPGVAWSQPATAIASGRNLKCSIATASASTANFTADELTLKNTTGGEYLAGTVSVTPDLAASGANGLDTGAEANSTWYYLWVIYNGTTVAGLWSTSATAPTMPSGYTYKALVSAAYNDGSGNLVPAYQRGNKVFWRGLRNMITNGGAVAETAITLTSFVPAIALDFMVSVKYMGVTGDGGGTSSATLYLRIVSGSDFNTNAYQLNAGGVGVFQGWPGPVVTVPYVGSFYYHQVVANGTGPVVTIDALGFTLPMGGE